MIGTLVKLLFASNKCWYSVIVSNDRHFSNVSLYQTSAGIVNHDQHFSNLAFPLTGSVLVQV